MFSGSLMANCRDPHQIDHHLRFLPMLLRNARLGYFSIIALVLLRFVIGFHFYMEGTAKVRDGGFSSVGFLTAAKGPLAKTFQSMVPDFDGSIRLDSGKDPESRKAEADYQPKDEYKKGALKVAYDRFASEAASLFKFTDEQITESKKIVEECRKLLAANYATYKEEIEEYKSGMTRIGQLENDEMRTNVASMRKQRDDIETKWKALAKPALNDIDRITADLEKRINALADDGQRLVGKKKLVASFKLPGSAGSLPIDNKFIDKIKAGELATQDLWLYLPIDVKNIDKFIPIFDMSVGILLMLGLLTPLAGLAAGIFLASVVLTQFPGSHGSLPTYNQAIEMLACFFLAFSDAGRYAGLDFLPWSFWNRNKKSSRN